jgi:transcriptional regulator of acetoin/glycerol metabolism
MGKIILEFDSNEERDDARTALDAYKWHGVVWDLDQYFRGIVKYGYDGNREVSSEEVDIADNMRTKLRSILEDYNLNLEE